MARIVIVDDDRGMRILHDVLHVRGHDVQCIETVDDALAQIEEIASADLVLLDIIIPPAGPSTSVSPVGPNLEGMEILREVRRRSSDLPIIIYSATRDAVVTDAIEGDPHTRFLSKWESPSLHDFVGVIGRALGLEAGLPGPQPFIVHGQSETDKLALKNYVQNTLGLPEPIVLHERRSAGRTIIEKFEDHAAASSLVFVLLTPADAMASAADSQTLKWRARQNVILELGYFLGALGRRSGRVLLLYRPPLDLPSDLAGVVYIDIGDGVEKAGEEIRREVSDACGGRF